jgi:hypothetical protein
LYLFFGCLVLTINLQLSMLGLRASEEVSRKIPSLSGFRLRPFPASQTVNIATA